MPIKKKNININDLRKKIQSNQLIRLKAKLNVKLTKEVDESLCDFKINKQELFQEQNLLFHTLNLAVALPNGCKLLVQIRNSTDNTLINEGLLSYQSGIFNEKIRFYTDQRFVDLSFKVLNVVLNQSYSIYKIILESDSEFTNTLDHDLTSHKNLEIFGDDFFKYVKLVNTDTGPESVIEQRDKYLELFGMDLINLYIGEQASAEYRSAVLYNLIMYIENNHYKKDTDSLNEEVEMEIKGKIRILTQQLEELIQHFNKLKIDRIDLNEKILEASDSLEKYKTEYKKDLEQIKESLQQQENLTRSAQAIDKPEFELEILELLRKELLKELNKTKKIKDILDLRFRGLRESIGFSSDTNNVGGIFRESIGFSSDTNNVSRIRDVENVKELHLLITAIFTQLGKDVLLVDEKIQDYTNVIDFFKAEFNNSKLYQEQKSLIEIADKNAKRCMILKEKLEKFYSTMNTLKKEQYEVLRKFISLKIEQSLLNNYFTVDNS